MIQKLQSEAVALTTCKRSWTLQKVGSKRLSAGDNRNTRPDANAKSEGRVFARLLSSVVVPNEDA